MLCHTEIASSGKGQFSRNLIQVFNCCDTFVKFVFVTRFDRNSLQGLKLHFNSRFYQFIFVEQSAQTSFELPTS